MTSRAGRWATAAAAAAALSLWHDGAAWRYAATGGFDARSARYLLSYGLWPAALAGGTLALCWLAGRGLWRLAEGPQLDGAIEELTALALGAGLAGFAALFVGEFGLYDRKGLLLVTAVLAPLAAGGVRRLPRAAARTAPLVPCLALLIYAAFHAAIRAAAPPTDWDVLAYHLALPKIYLGRGAVVELPWLLHSHWPHMMELLYGAALGAGRDGAAALAHAGLCAAWVALVGLTTERWGEGDAWLAAAIAAAQPVVLTLSGLAHSDGAWAFFHLAAAAALWRWRDSERRAWLLAAAFCAGTAAACKLLGLLALPVWLAWVWSRRRARAALAFAATAALPVAPWLLKAWLGAGDPVWPLLPRVFGGRWGGPAIAAAYVRLNLWSSWPPVSELLRYGPLSLLAPAAAAALIAAARRSRWPAWIAFLWLPAPVFVAALWRHHEGWRFLLPLYPAFAATIAWQAKELWPLGRGARAAALAIAAGALFPVALAGQSNELFATLALRSRTRPDADPRQLYLSRSLDHYDAYRRFSAELAGKRARVLLFREIRGYYLDVDYLWGDPYNQGLIDYRAMASSDELLKRLVQLRVTHVLVNDELGMYAPGSGYYDDKTRRLMDGVLARDPAPERDGPMSLHRLFIE